MVLRGDLFRRLTDRVTDGSLYSPDCKNDNKITELLKEVPRIQVHSGSDMTVSDTS